MGIKEKINADLKQAMLAGDKTLVMTLRGLKSVILYAEVAKDLREAGLQDSELIDLLSKEAKKRQESADLYVRGGNSDKAEAEMAEKKIIEVYLPVQVSDEELTQVVNETVSGLGVEGPAAMGQAIGVIKQKLGGRADGGRIATAVKRRLSQ
ncbi:GatB/YqeY domain-containing protein [Candidatus Saccharibacteria bacterium]|nr:GatB/YqeY domain-containing protein [Candidatus Saccharibacteria bacterium]